MERRKFLQTSSLLILGLFSTTSINAVSILDRTVAAGNKFKEKIISTIDMLKREGTNLVKKIMNGKEYEYNPYTHYPYDGGIKDEKTGCQLFFHFHREKEYGHFHTFAADEDGSLVHLVLISMSEEGKPIGLAAVNRWVTGDKYVKANVLKSLADNFFVEPALFGDTRIVEFVNDIFKAYKEEIFRLFDERDNWIKNYVDKNFREPFEDREFEVLAFRKIEL